MTRSHQELLKQVSDGTHQGPQAAALVPQDGHSRLLPGQLLAQGQTPVLQQLVGFHCGHPYLLTNT